MSRGGGATCLARVDRTASPGAGRDRGRSSTGDRTSGEANSGSEGGSDITVELCVRSLSPQGATARQEAVIERLEGLEARGVIEEFSLVIWGTRYPPESAAARTEVGRDLGRRIEAFERWVTQAETPDELAFERREIRSLVTDEAREEVVLPVLCLAVYDDEGLRCVSPWRTMETTHSIDDCLEAILRPGHVEGHPAVTIDESHPLGAIDDGT